MWSRLDVSRINIDGKHTKSVPWEVLFREQEFHMGNNETIGYNKGESNWRKGEKTMVERSQMNQIIAELCRGISAIFPDDRLEPILFGSYARGDAEEGSDIDILVLVDSPQEEISHREWEIGDIAGELLLNYGVLVSPVVENRDYYQRNAEILPFFRNIQREGVRMNA